MVFDLPDRAIQVMIRRDPTEMFSRAGRKGLMPSAEEIRLTVSLTDPAGSISGVLLTDQGLPPSAATALLSSSTIWELTSGVIDPASGEFAFDRVPQGTYELLFRWDGRGHIDGGRVDLSDGEQVDLGLTRMPATGRAVIDWSWSPDGGDTGLGFSISGAVSSGGTALVLKGPAPPPDHLDLLPGSYVLVAQRDKVLQRSSFEVTSGQQVQVVSGPAR